MQARIPPIWKRPYRSFTYSNPSSNYMRKWQDNQYHAGCSSRPIQTTVHLIIWQIWRSTSNSHLLIVINKLCFISAGETISLGNSVHLSTTAKDHHTLPTNSCKQWIYILCCEMMAMWGYTSSQYLAIQDLFIVTHSLPSKHTQTVRTSAINSSSRRDNQLLTQNFDNNYSLHVYTCHRDFLTKFNHWQKLVWYFRPCQLVFDEQ